MDKQGDLVSTSPGSRGSHAADAGAAPIAFLEALSGGGRIVPYSTAYGRVFLVNDPELTEHVMVSQNYVRVSLLKPVLGNGLITSNGAYWRQQRHLMQPAFHHQRIALFADLIVSKTIPVLDRWQARADSTPLEITTELTQLTLKIILQALFSAEIDAEAPVLTGALTKMMDDLGGLNNTVFGLAHEISGGRHREFQDALHTLDRTIEKIIADRRQKSDDPGDLLSLLLATQGAGGEGALTDRQVRDEVVTMLAAGHETTANMLSWALALLDANPDVERRLYAEISDVLGPRAPTFADLPRLTYTRMVLQETLRLYPPVWVMTRKAKDEELLAGVRIPADGMVVICPYLMHRHPACWDEPETFVPDRFLPERSADRPRYAYFPFGGGQHLCLGNQLALMEGQLVLATIIQRFALRLVPGTVVEPDPLVTLRIRGGLHMTVQPRSAAQSSDAAL